jgi:hypothetical protein
MDGSQSRGPANVDVIAADSVFFAFPELFFSLPVVFLFNVEKETLFL